MSQPYLPLVSVIIPYFNCEKYIAETLDSVEKQTYPNVEIIVVNDGSSKASSAYFEALLGDRTNIHYLHQKNQGVSSARNTGAKVAQGEFLLFLDADNKIHSDYLQKTTDVLIHNPNCKITYTKAELIESCTGEWILPPYTGFSDLLLGNKIDMLALVRKSDFDRLGGFDENLKSHEDWDYWIRLLQDGGEVICIDEILFSYRKRFDQSSLTDQLTQDEQSNKQSWQAVYIKHQDLFTKYHLSYFDLLNHKERLEADNSQLLSAKSNLQNLNDELTAKNVLLDELNGNLKQSIALLEKDKTLLKKEKRDLASTVDDLNNHIHRLNIHQNALTQAIHQESYKFSKFKKLWILRLLKPLIKLEQGLHSLNRYRKAFRLLMREKGSFGKAYQFLRRMTKSNGIKEARLYLKSCNFKTTPALEHAVNDLDSKRWQRNVNISNNSLVDLTCFSTSFNASSLNIHWVIPDFVKGGGGHQTIFRMVRFLELFGHRQTIWIQNANTQISLDKRKQDIQNWFAPIENVFLEYLPDNVEHISGDVVIATEAYTAYPVGAMKFFKERFYFIQDNEAQFYPMGADYLLASNTYDFGFSALCAGEWLLKMAQERGMWARSWELCADHSVYYPKQIAQNNKSTNEITIAFYARNHTPRRVVDLGLSALQHLHEQGINFTAYLFGQDRDEFTHYTFNYKLLGILNPTELSDLYNNSDIGMVFSSTNYSLIPLEMMACGLPIIEIDVESTRAVFPNDVVSLAKPNVKNIANTLKELIQNPNLRLELSKKSIEFASKTNWENSAKKIESAIIERLTEKGFLSYNWSDVFSLNEINNFKYKATIVIPTYNPSNDEISHLLDAISAQKTPWDFEILIIDSSSTNGVIDNIDIQKYRNLRVITIDKKDFQHGRTRKYAAEISFGEIIVYTTQDALPKNDVWLSNLLKPFEQCKEIAGAFGRHEAYENHDPFIQRDIKGLFDDFNKKPSIRKWDMPNLPSPNSLAGKLFRCFFSDNNSAVRKNVVNYIPYPEVEWGEDQVWAHEIISSGLEIAYADDAIVIHSHEYDEEKTLHTSIQEEKMFSEYFGYYFSNSKEEAEKHLASQIDYDEQWAKKNNLDSDLIRIRKLFLKDQILGRSHRFFKDTDLK